LNIVQWNADAMRLRRVTTDEPNRQPFWRQLARTGMKVIAVDVPLSLASGASDGIEITSWGAHDQLGPFECFPSEIANEIYRRFGRHPMGIEVPVDNCFLLHRLSPWLSEVAFETSACLSSFQVLR
jgi:hypothetical protein